MQVFSKAKSMESNYKSHQILFILFSPFNSMLRSI